MSPRRPDGSWDPEFVTIYFMQGARLDQKVAVRLARVVLGSILLVFGLVCLRVWQEMQIVKLGYECGELKLQSRRLQETQRTLLSQRNALAGLQRVETIARTELGLQTPERGQVIFLADPEDQPRGFAGWWQDRGRPFIRLCSAWWPFKQVKEAGLGGQDH
jgi:cell division protein FtsL